MYRLTFFTERYYSFLATTTTLEILLCTDLPYLQKIIINFFGSDIVLI